MSDASTTPYQRLIIEKRELGEKIVKLTEFIMSQKFETLDDDNRRLLNQQLSYMKCYHDTLVERIKVFKE
jgi:hypothetical protein